MNAPFSIADSFRFAWKIIREHSGVVFPSMLFLLGLELARELLRVALAGPFALLASMLLVALEVVVGIGLALISLQLAKGQSAKIRDILPSTLFALRYVCASCAVAALALAVFLLPLFVALFLGLAVPHFFPSRGTVISEGLFFVGALIGAVGALFVALRYFVVKYAALDDAWLDEKNGMHVVKILDRAASLTRGARSELLLFLLIIIAVNIVAAITILGLLLSIPLTLIAMARVYLDLTAKYDGATEPLTE